MFFYRSLICDHSQESRGKSVESFFKSTQNRVSPTLTFMTSFLLGSGTPPPHEYQISIESNVSGGLAWWLRW